MVQTRLGPHNVVAVFHEAGPATEHPHAGQQVVSPAHGRGSHALEALAAEGIGPPEVSLLAADRQMPPGSTRPRAGRGTMQGLGRYLLIGMTTGTLVGAVLGALGGALLGLLPAVASPATTIALYGAVAGAVMGHVAAALIALETHGRKTAMWEQSLHPLVPAVRDGATLVAVHTDDEQRADRAAELLEGVADEVRRYEADDAYRGSGLRDGVVGPTVPSEDPEAPGGRYEPVRTGAGER